MVPINELISSWITIIFLNNITYFDSLSFFPRVFFFTCMYFEFNMVCAYHCLLLYCIWSKIITHDCTAYHTMFLMFICLAIFDVQDRISCWLVFFYCVVQYYRIYGKCIVNVNWGNPKNILCGCVCLHSDKKEKNDFFFLISLLFLLESTEI